MSVWVSQHSQRAKRKQNHTIFLPIVIGHRSEIHILHMYYGLKLKNKEKMIDELEKGKRAHFQNCCYLYAISTSKLKVVLTDPPDTHRRRQVPSLLVRVVVVAAGTGGRCLFVKCRLVAKRPTDPAYPTELNTLGDHLRKVRLDRGLSQPDVAKIIGVTPHTVTNWELRCNEPTAKSAKLIIDFLGYFPFHLTIHLLESSFIMPE